MKKFLVGAMLILLFATCKDSCPDCKNGGSCIEGDCDCPDRFTGSDCSAQIQPPFISITYITLDKLPALDPFGNPWDPGDAPDIYLLIKQFDDIAHLALTKHNAGVGAQWTISPAYFSSAGPLEIEVWDDDDGGSDDLIGIIEANLYNSTGGFPEHLVLDCSTCTVGLTLKHLIYKY